MSAAPIPQRADSPMLTFPTAHTEFPSWALAQRLCCPASCNMTDHFMSICSSESSSHPLVDNCFLAPVFLSPSHVPSLSSLCLCLPSLLLFLSSQQKTWQLFFFFLVQQEWNLLVLDKEVFLILLISTYSQYLHNILSMWGKLKGFGSMLFG